jgi:hypothetical protein
MRTSSGLDEAQDDGLGNLCRDARRPVSATGHHRYGGGTFAREWRTDIVASNSNATDSFPYPRGSVVGVLTDDATFQDARQRLERSGFGADRCDVLHGDQGLARIDVEGDAHGAVGHITRWVQAAVSDDADHVRRYVEYLRAGDYVVGVAVGDDEAAKQRAAEAFRAAHAEFLDYYGENYVEDLSANA